MAEVYRDQASIRHLAWPGEFGANRALDDARDDGDATTEAALDCAFEAADVVNRRRPQPACRNLTS